ncbi:Efflux pump membrane transporter BepE [Planctomycetes bacterium Pan216]|uniref:Efflux pump membrane transporter BepE n=1 Tax=Kolteria novifilia TaxID=2527975 RepID=A0A518BAE9_9BACT|nr:Efflux pump membrane transporter BepE [Planctomycetes bacterium Pan216]
MSRFFIKRPIFAMVCSIMITLMGVVALLALPVAQYPPIVPPTIQVTTSYPGANSVVLAETVAEPIEEQVNGVEGMIYMSSTCSNNGDYTLTVSFDIGTDPNMALMFVQTRIQNAIAQLPDIVQKQGITTRMQSPNILIAINLVSPNGRYDQLYMSNYAEINIFDALSRLPGVGTVLIHGERDYSMRAWIDPEKLAELGLTTTDVYDAISEQNVEVAPGFIGQPPVPAGQAYELVLQTKGRLTSIEEFGDIIVKVGQRGALVRLKDVADIRLGSQNSDLSAYRDGAPSVALAVYPLPEANSLSTARGVYALLDKLEKDFPDGLEWVVGLDTTPYIRSSIQDVVGTLLTAIGLVAIVVLLFLQNWRAALIPLVAVPVAIVGTFSAMAALGFSLNMLSLFGLVLAIGIVVDDAIVVVENVERWLEEGYPPDEAAANAMEEVQGPIVGVLLVLCAVFVPCAFIPGLTGLFFRQFALTIAVSTAFSAFNSLTLSPALAALLLRKRSEMSDPITRVLNAIFGWFFRLFNRGFDWGTKSYTWIVGGMLRLSLLVLVLYGGLLALTVISFTTYPTGLIPQQDQGYIIANVQLPESASLERTSAVLEKLDKIAREQPGVHATMAISGFSIIVTTDCSNWGTLFITLDPFSKRTTPETQAAYITAKLNKIYREEIIGARVDVMGAPPVPGLGQSGGFQLQIEDQTGLGLSALEGTAEALVDAANQQPGLKGVFTSFTNSAPQLYLDINRTMVMQTGVKLSDVFNTLNVSFGSVYVNLFNEFGRVWQVNIMAEGKYRTDINDMKLLQVKNQAGETVPIGSFLSSRPTTGPLFVMRYNDLNSASINGGNGPGYSSGQAISLVEQLCEKHLPPGMTYDWTNLSYQEVTAGNTGILIFGLAVLVAFLVLAALYESWSLPFAIILIVPMCLLCALAGVASVGNSMDIFVQIGFVVLIGMAAKNAILIVEFAKQEREKGLSRREATLSACRLRIRPILMTSVAFIAGVYPLAVATGAGWEMRRSLGTAVLAGMFGVTLFGVFLTPVFYYVITWFGRRRDDAAADVDPAAT